MRVLHLIDGTRGPGASLDLASGAAGLVAARGGGEHASFVVGPGASRRRATNAGAPPGWHAAPPLRRATLAARAVRAAARTWAPDVVHCWGGAMLGVARLAFGPEMPLVAVMEGKGAAQTGAMVHWFGTPLTGAILLCYNDADRAALEGLWPEAEVQRIGPPTLEAGAPQPDPSGARAELGVAPDELTVLLIGDAPQADSLRFAFLMGLMQVAGRSVVGVMPSSATGRRRGARLRRRSIHRLRAVVTDRPLRDVAPACNLAVWDAGGYGPAAHWETDTGAGATAVASVLAMGVPVVSPACPALEALYPPSARGLCVARNSSLPELARVLMGLAVDERARKVVGVAVAEHARAADGDGAFVRAVRDAWTRAIGAAASVSPGVSTTPVWGMGP